MKRDLTKGSIIKNLLYMSIPAILGSLAQMIYSLTDMFWIGKISSVAVAATTVMTSVFFLSFILSTIISISSISLITQHFGTGDKEKTATAIEQTILFKGLVAIITLLIMVFALKPLLMFLSKDAEIIKYAYEYGIVRIIFLPITFIGISLIDGIRCVGDSKKPMILIMCCALLNIVLDPIFMFKTVPLVGIRGLGLGIKGAALATAFTNVVTFVVGFIILLGGYTNIKIKLSGLFKLNKEMDKQLILIGLPVGLEMAARDVGGVLIMKFLATYSVSVIAANGITLRITSFAFMIMMGLANGGGTIAGQNLGAENIDRAEQTAYAAVKLGLISLSVFTLIVMLFAPQIIGIFIKDNAVISAGSILLKLSMIGVLTFTVGLCLSSVFTGAGYNFPFVVSSIASKWIVQIPLLYITVSVLKLPFYWIAISYIVAESIESLILVWYFKKGQWKTHRVT